MLNAGGGWYEMNSGGHLMTVKSASSRLNPRLLVGTPSGFRPAVNVIRERAPVKDCGRPRRSSRRWRLAGARAADDCDQRELLRRARPEGWVVARPECSSPLGAYVDNTRGQGRANAAVTGTLASPASRACRAAVKIGRAATMILPVGGAAVCGDAEGPERLRLGLAGDSEAARPGRAICGGNRHRSADPGRHRPTERRRARARPARRSATTEANDRDVRFQGGSYTPDQIQDLFRGLGCRQCRAAGRRRLVGDRAAARHRRNVAGAGCPKGNCDTRQVLCDSRERALPSWLAFS